MKLPEKATQPTMYFIGVTTGQSSIMKLFPLWASALGIENAVIKGIDVEMNADPDVYRKVVDFIKNDELSMGALVTTHKINLYNACKDMFEYLDPYAKMFGELSSISKKDGRLCGHAKDPITSGLALEAFIPRDYWKKHQGDVFVIGAGGSGIAVTAYLIDNKDGNVPSKVHIANRSKGKLEKAERIIKSINTEVEYELHVVKNAKMSDEILEELKPHSLIINATGMGKDIPGSPLSDDGQFPSNSLVWEFNYRGELDFMHQAIRQKEEKSLFIEDGWIYFIHGWTQVISEVFHVNITDELFEQCKTIAEQLRSSK